MMASGFVKLCLAAVLVGLLQSGAGAESVLFVTTGHTGAQVQADVNHTQQWNVTVAADVADVVGARFQMKAGPHTTAPITFAIYDQTNPLEVLTVLQATLGPSAFTQSFAPALFQDGSHTLLAGHTYTATLTSPAPDRQAKAYFIKEGRLSTHLFADGLGNAVTASEVAPAASEVPLPTAALGAAVLLGGLAVNRSRCRG